MASKGKTRSKLQENLWTLRDKYDSTADFADALGLSRQSVSFWLNGDREPDAKSLCLIRNKMHVSIDWLLGYEAPNIETSECGHNLHDYNDLPD
jgi:Predicted transcriptional regulators